MGLGQGLVQRLENGIVGKEKNCQDGKMNNIKRMVKNRERLFLEYAAAACGSEKRHVYDLCFFRHIDDIVDGEADMDEKLELINAWREELDNIYDKKLPTTDIGRKIYKNCMRFKLPKEEFIKMIDSISMDLPNPVQAPTMEKFNQYCRGVAGVPGNLSLRIFGCTDQQIIEELATTLGAALQITNILRDVKEDAQAQRLYIPEEFCKSRNQNPGPAQRRCRQESRGCPRSPCKNSPRRLRTRF